ncbi:very short patch repair endonuclease [Bradyrhizobium sp. USDA 223]|uniref:very short patch repair endonuclease n=1 Tax=Bradyrhizobium sp. USDA 223 TaxID=3156306 RepID=UPI003832BEFD
MADRLTPEQRSAHMARIGRCNTRPELMVRQLLTEIGYRYRIHLGGVPGRPDVAFTKRKKAVFIHGCFWHAHENCRVFKLPSSRKEFWERKFENNKARDKRLLEAAEEAGWQTLVVWECELSNLGRVSRRLKRFLGPPRHDEKKAKVDR